MTTDTTSTTWGDCGNPDCDEYGETKYGLPDSCSCKSCGESMRTWDRKRNRPNAH